MPRARRIGVIAFVLTGGALACSPGGPEAVSDAGPRDAPSGGGPYLVGLTVAAPGSSEPSTAFHLHPAFSPEVHDYTVICVDETTTVEVTLTAAPGATGSLKLPATTPAEAKQTATLEVQQNGAIVAVATDARTNTSTEYWVRCLPPDFPAFSWVEYPGAGTRTPGYYLLGVASLSPQRGPYAFVLDTHGAPVWYARAALPANSVFDVDSVEDGGVSFFPISGSDFVLDVPAAKTTSTLALEGGAALDEHELRRLPNGHFLAISSAPRRGVNLTGMRVPDGDGGIETLQGTHTIATCTVLELTADGEVVWIWDANDHFDPVRDSIWPSPLGSDTFDIFHCNSIDVDPESGNLLVSAREMDSVFYVERKTGRVLWKMGGASFEKEGAPFVAVADPFSCQHDARLLPGWSQGCSGGHGQVSLFDDRTSVPGRARGVIYDVTVGPAAGTPGCDGGVTGSSGDGNAALAWEYAGAQAAYTMGSFRISADGSRVIGWGEGPGARGFTEVSEDKKALLDFVFDDGLVSYRAIKVPLEAFDLEALRRSVGPP